MNFLQTGKKLSLQSQADEEADRRQKEAQEFDLVQIGGFLSVVKYAVFGILAALNLRLFISVVPGAWGLVIGITAVLFEAFAVYAWNNQARAAERHRQALYMIAVVFTAVSFVHASASFYELIGLGPSLGWPLYIYSHAIAFPLLFTLMTAAVCVLHRTHWSAEAAMQQAKTQTDIARNRADLLRRTAALQSKAELGRAELSHYEDELRNEQSFLNLLERVVSVESEKDRLLSTIRDEGTRKRMAEILQRDLNRNGVPDVLEHRELQNEAHSLLNGPTSEDFGPRR
jgi:hypothetical protein